MVMCHFYQQNHVSNIDTCVLNIWLRHTQFPGTFALSFSRNFYAMLSIDHILGKLQINQDRIVYIDSNG